MTVRAKAELSRVLGSDAPIKGIWAISKCSGELQVQVVLSSGQVLAVNIPSANKKGVNLLGYASPAEWKKSRSLLSAVRMGHLSVSIER